MELISRQVLDLWDKYKPTIAIDAIEYDRELKQLLGTDLAEVGTDVPDINVGELISRQQAIDALENDKVALDKIIKGMSAIDAQLNHYVAQYNQVVYDIDAIEQLPPIQPDIVRCKDCRHYRHGLCMKASMCVNKSPNGFCDWGERREVTT